MQAGMNLTFYGVRGSTPCHCSSMARFGGNTSCVVLESDSIDPIIFDAGTGLRFYGLGLGDDLFAGTMVISHLHWDHVQGLPFFPQLLESSCTAKILGPPEAEETFGQALGGLIRPPYFPVRLDEFASELNVGDIYDESIEIDGGATLTARPVPHTGRTNGYRVDLDGRSVAYIPDHQQPAGEMTVTDAVLELADGVDVLIHDAQFTPELLKKRSDWGHCTAEYAVQVAREAGVGQLVLFHHDPLHDDVAMEQILASTQSAAPDLMISAASEGMKISI